MDLDLIFVIGCIVAALSIPAMVSAFSDSRTPRYPAIVILIGVLMIGFAVNERPGAYSFDTLPDVFAKVIGRYLG